MERTYKNKQQVESVLKEALWLAYCSAGHPVGMGIYQSNPTATKEDVWKNATGIGDYPVATSREGMLYADYVFGRMMKLRINYGKKTIEVPDRELRWDYQAWSRTYKTYADLIDAAEKAVL